MVSFGFDDKNKNRDDNYFAVIDLKEVNEQKLVQIKGRNNIKKDLLKSINI